MTAVETAASLFATLDAAGAAADPGASFDRSALEAIVEAGVYGVSVPAQVGGLDLPLVEVVDVWAELARADGSIGWCAFAIRRGPRLLRCLPARRGDRRVFAGWAAGDGRSVRPERHR
jgi:alkylation response protein AidB-like acyl-CoA dehydrogenase